ncbi:MAG: CHASE2 domain-containing protein [Bryobacteraceae bacterium]
MRRPGRQQLEYCALLAAAFAIATVTSWTSFATQIDNDAYDFWFRLYKPVVKPTEAILLAVDEESYREAGGLRGLRRALAEGLDRVAKASPRAVVVDLILAEDSDPESDERLEAAFRSIPGLVLASDIAGAQPLWEEPIPRFAKWARAVGHVHADPDPLDAVSREILLAKVAGRQRYWALALEAFRVSRGADILESPENLRVGEVVIPASHRNNRSLLIRYLPPDRDIPEITLRQLRADESLAAEFSGKTVFAGITAQTAARDRLMTPYSYGVPMSGLEIHAHAFETIAQQNFFTVAPAWSVLAVSLALVLASGAIFAWGSGWRSNAMAVCLLAVAHAGPYFAFTQGIVFPFAPALASVWTAVVLAAAYQHFVVRLRLEDSESERQRYRHAMHFVTHEMRTPLTAIQGSSELMGRYALPEEKRKQIADLIHSESKRLGKMIEVFLSVERLSAGGLELKKEQFAAPELIRTCVERVLPVAGRKQIGIHTETLPLSLLSGDRELMEYAVYNLLTNAVKYSPPKTTVTVSAAHRGEHLHLCIEDQGMGMDQKEVSRIFQRFYRTRKAEESGEAGTGIGLSIVEQIVSQHAGRIDVFSRPGEGSRFTLILPAQLSAAAAEHN